MAGTALQPVVFVRDGGVFANSHDVAPTFGKRHDHVLRDIAALIHTPNLGDEGKQQLTSFFSHQQVGQNPGHARAALAR